uniref:Uncharacterized protein n=1 Tax=Trypanosoma congolense (strain IL3000) TaxID=1068625 RepID=G0UPW2_TRYCI|nr:conserved hypothetical protein [Trypanosoma congolense IL3000]
MQKQFGYIVRNSWMMGPAPQNAEGHNAALKRVEKEREEAGLTNNIGTRRSAALHIYQLSDTSPSAFYLAAFGEEFKIYALPVEHGKGYMSLGFVFGRGIAFRSRGESDPTNYSCVVYISDVSFVPPEAMAFLHDLVKIDVLIIDLLYGPGKNHPSHYCMDECYKL